MTKKFKYLLVPETWEQYWTRYPQGYTILEALINWVSQVNEMTDNVNDWNERLDLFLEQFDDKLGEQASNILKEWKDDGTLEYIINESILGSRARVVVGTTEPEHDNLTLWYEVVGTPIPPQGNIITVSEEEPEETTQIWYDVE